MNDILALSLKDVPLLSIRTINVLKRNGIETLGDIVSKNHSDLLKIRDLGRRSINEIEVALENLGFQYSPINNQTLMANKPTKPVHQAKVFTPEQIRDEKRMQALQQLAQRRESFAINILCNLVHAANQKVVATMDSTKITVDTKGLVDLSVEMADHLMEKLYKPQEESKG